MLYKLIRFDGKEDSVTVKRFKNYDDAYNFLVKIYGDVFCSDFDYEDRPYCDIVQIKQNY